MIPFLFFLLKEPPAFRWSAFHILGQKFACSRKGQPPGKSPLGKAYIHYSFVAGCKSLPSY